MDGDAARARIESRLSDVLASNTTEGTFTTGSFAFSEPDMRTAIQNWLDLAHSYDKSVVDAYSLTGVAGPGEDFASESFAIKANESGQSVIGYFTNNRDYCKEQAQLFYNALNDYLGLEHKTIAEFNKKDPQQGPQPGV